jgi:hypothetical protein
MTEPEDQTDPCPHTAETALAGSHSTIVAASQRGKSHAHTGKWREDAYKLALSGPWSVVAVSDGAGSAELSRIGASIATEAAVAAMVRETMSVADDDPRCAAERALHAAVQAAHAAVSAEADRRATPVSRLASTLLLVLHLSQPEGASLVGHLLVGDGAVLIDIAPEEEGGADHVVALDSGDHGLSAGETAFLIQQPPEAWVRRARVEQYEGRVRLIAVATDGVADDLYPYEVGAPKLFKALNDEVLCLPMEAQATALQRLISYTRRGSFDDRTLVVISPHGSDRDGGAR